MRRCAGRPSISWNIKPNDPLVVAAGPGRCFSSFNGCIATLCLGAQPDGRPQCPQFPLGTHPRGGGVAIVLSFLAALPLLAVVGVLPWPVLWALMGAGAWVAVVGFLDDHGHIAARWRLLAHFIGAAWALGWLGGLPSLAVFGFDLELGWLGYVLAAFYLVWLLNLYNFMDGIDGIASVEAISVCLGARCSMHCWVSRLPSGHHSCWL